MATEPKPDTPLRARRKALGLSAEQVAVAINSNVQRIYDLERGRVIARLAEARLLAVALNCTTEDIFPTDIVTSETPAA